MTRVCMCEGSETGRIRTHGIHTIAYVFSTVGSLALEEMIAICV